MVAWKDDRIGVPVPNGFTNIFPNGFTNVFPNGFANPS